MRAATRLSVLFAGLMVALPAFAQAAPEKPQASAPSSPPADTPSKPKVPAAQTIREVKRIFVDSFGDDTVTKQIQAMVVSQLVETGKFKVTENREKADAILKGAGLEKTSQQYHAYSSETAGGSATYGESGSIPGTFSGGGSAVAAKIADSNASTETVNDARIAVRLVNQDGDVIWATTQESKGGKYKGASADVADKVVKQLLKDLERPDKKSSE